VAATIKGREIHPHGGAEWLPPWKGERYTLIGEQIAATMREREIFIRERAATAIRELRVYRTSSVVRQNPYISEFAGLGLVVRQSPRNDE
jgi:hypothetical protein